MIRFAMATALAGSLACFVSGASALDQVSGSSAPVRSNQMLGGQPSPGRQPSVGGAQPSDRDILVDYIEPVRPEFFDLDKTNFLDPSKTNPDYAEAEQEFERLNDIKTRLQKRRLLEEYSEFLAPMRFPGKLRLVAKQCGQVNAFYSAVDRTIFLCYELVREIEDKAPKSTTPQGISRAEAILGGVVSVLLHETGHALFNLLHVPVLGREEDAADQIAAYVMVQFGRETARTTTKGAAWTWLSQDWSKQNFFLSDVHSTPQQRFMTFLCIAYGSDPEGFKDFVDLGWLPAQRTADCAREYAQADLAFRKTVLPHVDEGRIKQVFARPWIRPEDVQ